jgi:hemoglobin-like flavoprotein
MSPESRGLIRNTWQLVVPIADTAAGLFYNRLFETDPRLRKLFDGVDLQSQRRKLIQALALVVGSLDRIEQLAPALEALGQRHRTYGVANEHYDTVGAALLWTLERGLGTAWSMEARAAWADAYRLVASLMDREVAAQGVIA